VGLDGAHRQSELGGNRLVAHPQHHVPQDVAFTARQGLLLHTVGYATRNERTERDASQVYRPQTGREILQAAPEQQITPRALFECMADLRLTVTVREDHDTATVRGPRGNHSQSRVVIGDYNIRRRHAQGTAHGHLELTHPPQSGLESRRDQRIGVHNQHFDFVVGTH